MMVVVPPVVLAFYSQYFNTFCCRNWTSTAVCPGEGSSSAILLKVSSFFLPIEGLLIFSEFFTVPIWRFWGRDVACGHTKKSLEPFLRFWAIQKLTEKWIDLMPQSESICRFWFVETVTKCPYQKYSTNLFIHRLSLFLNGLIYN